MEIMQSKYSFFDVSINKKNIIKLVTLGPEGTSSERSAHYLGNLLIDLKSIISFEIHLCDTYEEASELILLDDFDGMVVANAYHKINEFYMNNKLKLSAAFLNMTPDYGVATNRGCYKKKLNIATHPAPVQLITELLPSKYSIKTITLKKSTSSAAMSVVSGESDAALTTSVAAEKYNLDFITKVRPIEMLWSLFTLSQ